MKEPKHKISKCEKQEFYWTLKMITGTWISSGINLKKEARQTLKSTEV